MSTHTTRTVISLLFSGAFTRFADIRFIFCHAGGSVPVIAERMTQYGPKDLIEKLPHGVDYELKRLYYDIAVSGHRPAVAALTSFVPTSQILFGSDFPYRGRCSGKKTRQFQRLTALVSQLCPDPHFTAECAALRRGNPTFRA
jgi:predicted TIM-barrel fold metal-dependent hydrolase